jgi:[acyl-carrier-protein] S-malonyltransferase
VLALLFPGQGSQEVGMGRELVASHEAARTVFDSADAALGFALSRICFEGPEDELRRTEIQQPAILACGIALLRALEETTAVAPAFVAGHSLGEYTALVASGALRFEDAIRVVHARGRYMQEAVPEGRGAMAAVVGASAKEVTQACQHAAEQSGGVVAPANFNSPQQTVIAGEAVAVELACSRAREQGAKRTIPLAVSAPFHCALMAPAAEKLALELECVAFTEPAVPIVTNVEATPNRDPARMPALLKQQVCAPVRFTEMVEKLIGLGVSHFLEIGTGRVLTGLLARIHRGSSRANLAAGVDIEGIRGFLAEAAV